MSREARYSEGRNGDMGVSKRWQSSQTEAALFDQHTRQSMFPDEPISIYESQDASKFCTKSCVKNLKEKKIKPSRTRSGCSKHCTGYKKDVNNQSCKKTTCSPRKNDKLGYRIKRSKKKLQQISNQVKKRTKQSVRKIKKMYENLSAKRVAGFKCDIRKCKSTVLDCSASECAKPNMLFSTFYKLRDKITRDKEDTSYTICHSKPSRVGTKNNDLMVVKEKSTETSVDEETSM